MSHLRLGGRQVVVSPLVGGSVEPPTQWAALRAAHAEVGQRPLRSILVPRAGIEPARHLNRQGILSPSCLPIPPPGHEFKFTQILLPGHWFGDTYKQS